MRNISSQRKLVEEEGHIHAVFRGVRWRFHFENIPALARILSVFLRITHSMSKGLHNALNIKLEHLELTCPSLPAGFDNTRILLITDLHIDVVGALADRLMTITRHIDYDYCFLGGDYTFRYGRDDHNEAQQLITYIARQLTAKAPVFAVLGNHDRYSMAQVLADAGVEVLINESRRLDRNGDTIYISGVDDCHYYGSNDLDLADSETEAGAFKIMLSHSPELYKPVAGAGYSLYLAGHTHGGQICLPGGKALVRGATVPRNILKGKWNYQNMLGYTSRGMGSSGVPVRYFCPPEISLITLKK